MTIAPSQALKDSTDQTDREQLLKATSMLTASTSAINDLPAFQLKPVLLPIFQDVWPSIARTMQARFNDKDLIETFCEYLIKLGRALKQEFMECFPVV